MNWKKLILPALIMCLVINYLAAGSDWMDYSKTDRGWVIYRDTVEFAGAGEETVYVRLYNGSYRQDGFAYLVISPDTLTGAVTLTDADSFYVKYADQTKDGGYNSIMDTVRWHGYDHPDSTAKGLLYTVETDYQAWLGGGENVWVYNDSVMFIFQHIDADDDSIMVPYEFGWRMRQ